MEHGDTVTQKVKAFNPVKSSSTAGMDTTKTTVVIPRPLLARAKAAAAVANPRSSVQDLICRALSSLLDQLEGKEPCQA